MMNEFHGTCPSCGAYLYVKQAPVTPEKPYTRTSFRWNVIFGIVLMAAAGLGLILWLPHRTGAANDTGPIFLIGLAAVIGFAALMMAFDKRDKAAGKPQRTLAEMYTADQIVAFLLIVVSVISLGLGIVGIIERHNPNWRGAVGCLVVPVAIGLIYLYVYFQAKRKKQ